jgi:hypothetical protein
LLSVSAFISALATKLGVCGADSTLLSKGDSIKTPSILRAGRFDETQQVTLAAPPERKVAGSTPAAGTIPPNFNETSWKLS